MRPEVKLCSYSLENVVSEVLHRRLPRLAAFTLHRWWLGGKSVQARAVHLLLDRARATLQVLEKLNWMGRTAESARLFGVDFYNLLNRGTQYVV